MKNIGSSGLMEWQPGFLCSSGKIFLTFRTETECERYDEVVGCDESYLQQFFFFLIACINNYEFSSFFEKWFLLLKSTFVRI